LEQRLYLPASHPGLRRRRVETVAQHRKRIIVVGFSLSLQRSSTTDRFFFSVEVIADSTRRKNEKVKKSDRKAVKALRSAYHNSPDDFEEEPEALHSDADLEEETMVMSFLVIISG
jgi:site-specific DNA-cytosine methylase